MIDVSQSVMLPTVGGRDQNARRKARKVVWKTSITSAPPGGGGRIIRPISRMRKVRLRKGAVSGEIHLRIGFCVLSAVSTLFQGTLREQLRL